MLIKEFRITLPMTVEEYQVYTGLYSKQYTLYSLLRLYL